MTILENSIYTKSELLNKINDLNNRIDNLTDTIRSLHERENALNEKIGFLNNQLKTKDNKILNLKCQIEDKDFKFKQEQRNPKNTKLTDVIK